MQDIVVLDLLIGIEMKPALTALPLRSCVPRNRQRLHAAVGKFDQILLQRIDTEGVFDLEDGELPVRPIGLDKKFPTLAKEAGVYAVIIERRVIEITEHRRFVRMLHGELMLGMPPKLCLRLMAAGAGLAADEGCD